MDQVTYFSSLYKVNQHMSQFSMLFIFMSKYKVPWIFKWQYNIVNNIVIRQYFVKWWDAFKQQYIIDQVKQKFPVQVPAPVQQITALFQVQQNPVRLGSPSSSSKPTEFKSKSKSKNSELLIVAKLILVKAQAINEEESDGSNDFANSKASTSKDPYGSQSQDT